MQIFTVGQIVCLKADSTRQGPIIEVLSPVAGISRYRVFHSPTDIRDYQADQLVGLDSRGASDSLIRAALASNWIEPAIFQSRLTAARLAYPQVDNLYALHSARIQFIPFQLKPLLRLLRADRPRLLIADEVGVGKTIEAGLILKELQTRKKLNNILILCPKALVTKWREEMRRFDEEFRPLTAETLRYCLHETHLDGVWPSQHDRAIVHLELLRNDQYLMGKGGKNPSHGMATLDPSPHFDLVIVDEAHHVRTPETNSHHLARFLCDVSDAVVFLSATPVHVGSQNLFSLLNLLRSDVFPDFDVFKEMIAPNSFILDAIRYIRTSSPANEWQQLAAQSLEKAVHTPWGQSILGTDELFHDWQKKLTLQKVQSDLDRVRCIRDLEETHTLAHIMNRTRRRDIGKFTIRDPHTVAISFTKPQQAFYEALLEFRRSYLLQWYESGVVRLIMDTLERQAASCLPAIAATLSDMLNTNRHRLASVSDDPELDLEEFEDPFTVDVLQKFKELQLEAANVPTGDPKFTQLDAIIRQQLMGTGSRKVLVFSFFLNTLAYLEDRFKQTNIRVATITGRVADEERDNLRNRFRLPSENIDAIDVLLSSEVGCEGLDYEFCDCLVNYDIPWNPMRIEQRIGRVDRFGQSAEKVFIFNFITPGTVEERIFFRCFDRLGIFRDSVGDLEGVLGEVVDGLTKITMTPDLTPEQANEKARQLADNAIRLIEEEQRLEAESGMLIELDKQFAGDVNQVVQENRFVSPSELQQMVSLYVEQPHLGGKLFRDEKISELFRLRLRKDSRDFIQEKLRQENRQDRPTTLFKRWLQGDELFYPLTFDQGFAIQRRDIAFITPIHPLARLAVKFWQENDMPLVSHLTVLSDLVKAGQFAFLCEIWETIGIKPEIRLARFCVNIATRMHAPELENGLIPLLQKGEISNQPVPQTLAEIFRDLDTVAFQARQDALDQLAQRNEMFFTRRLTSLETYYNGRIGRAKLDLENATEERIQRMRKSEYERLKQELRQQHQDLENRRQSDIVTKRIAVGLLEVVNGK